MPAWAAVLLPVQLDAPEQPVPHERRTSDPRAEQRPQIVSWPRLSALLVEEDEVRWADGDVVARHVRRLGPIVLTERRMAIGNRPTAENSAGPTAPGVVSTVR